MRRVVWCTLMAVHTVLIHHSLRPPPEPTPGNGATVLVQDSAPVYLGVDMFNTLVGCRLVARDGKEHVAYIHISEMTNQEVLGFLKPDVVYGNVIAGFTIPTNSGSYIVLNSDNKKEITIKTVVHELGHAFGLRHSSGTHIMTPMVTDASGLYFKPDDLERLRTQCPAR